MSAVFTQNDIQHGNNKATSSNRILHTVIIGGGPAGCGLLTNFALNGEYDDLLDHGVAVVESSSRLGGGSLNQYHQLRSNSHGCAFFDAFEDLGLDSHDNSLNRSTVIPMSDLHLLQDSLGSWHQENLSRHPISQAITDSTVVDVKEEADGTYCIQYAQNGVDTSTLSKLFTRNVCLCTGGMPYTPSWLLEHNTPLKQLEAANDYFLGTRTPSLEAKNVAIIGFSHSAFSLGHLWHTKIPSTQITFIQRAERSQKQPFIYFPSIEEAKEVEYSFRKADVCLETNRVHRFGGLRGDARDFALQHDSYRSISMNDFRADDYDRIIVACGYKIRSIPIMDRNGTKLEPEYNGGGTKVDSQGRLFPDHQIYAFGIGAGLKSDEKIGGEPGCTRRSDGIWLYQYTVGSVIRTSLLECSVSNGMGKNVASIDKPVEPVVPLCELNVNGTQLKQVEERSPTASVRE